MQARAACAARNAAFAELAPASAPANDALEEPEHSGERDRAAQRRDPAHREPGALAQVEDERQGNRHDRQLARLDAQVERHEGDGYVGARERYLSERAGEAEAVHEAERKRDAPAVLRALDEEV